jgi:hypothetical protein
MVPPGRKSVHGTAQSFPSLLELDELDAVEDGLGELGEDGLVELLVPLGSCELLELADALSEITAKSSLPDAGFRMSSLMVPNESPEELLTSTPMSLLARMSR